MFEPNRVEGFLSRTYRFMDLLIFKKIKLLGSNIFRKNGSEAIWDDLGDDLV